MAGGGGTRLWPASTDQRPKQLFDPLLGTPASSLLAQTADRLCGLVQPQDIWVVVGHDQLAGTRQALPETPAANFVVEPMRRNTAPCIALALAFIQHALGSDADDATLVVVPADHHVRDPEHMRDLLRTACLHAEVHHTVVALGIQPSHASTAFGYIERATAAAPSVTGDGDIAVFPAKRFVEKPNAATARKFVDSGVYSWNAGIFVMPLSRIDAELQRHCTALYAALQPVREAIEGQRDTALLVRDAYAKIAAVPIDVAVMEKQQDLRMIPASIGWTDLGSWRAVHAIGASDDNGNVCIQGPSASAVVMEGHDNLVWSQDATIGVLGVSGLAIVACGGRVLVCPLDRAQEVKALLDAMSDGVA